MDEQKQEKKAIIGTITIILFVVFILIQLGFWYYIYDNVEYLRGEDACSICQERTGRVCNVERFSINLTGDDKNFSYGDLLYE